jgi:Ni,Fe-hydrogenase I cytochrome b subunit
MSQAAVFGFGCVIFFIVMTGALLYGMASFKAFAERSK